MNVEAKRNPIEIIKLDEEAYLFELLKCIG